MTQEEKAKAYDRVSKEVKDFFECRQKMYSDVNQTLEHLFPELKESEDENIKHDIIEFIKKNKNPFAPIPSGITLDKWIAWLEKQGQKPQGKSALEASKEEKVDNQNCVKPTDKIEPKFKVGNKIKLAKEPEYPAREIIAIQNDAYYFDEAIYLPFSRQDEWELVGQKPAEWNTNDEQMLNSTIKDLIHPCYEEIPDRIEEEIKWIKSMRNRVVSQPKMEWSEEDENRFRNLIYLVEHSDEGKGTKEGFVKFIYRLKSLRPQSQWKPSDEQMYNLSEAAHCDCVFFDMEILKGLYDELKKL